MLLNPLSVLQLLFSTRSLFPSFTLYSTLSSPSSSPASHASIAPDSLLSSSTLLDRMEEEAIVTQPIAPHKVGQIKFRGSWWRARSNQTVTLNPGDVVYVIGRENITLYVELAPQALDRPS